MHNVPIHTSWWDTLSQSEAPNTHCVHTMKLTITLLLLSLTPVVTSYVNDFDKPVLYQCPRGNSIASWESYHSNHHEDRRHRFTCQKTPELGKCQWSGYVNQFDKPISFQCPNNGVISGVNSYHSNHHEDRRFKFYCCSLKGKHLVHCGTIGYVNCWDEKIKFRMPAAHFLKGVFSIHHNHYEDRRWKFETCLID
ncbi:hemagglutinin/amebocyte aggregation factor-like isoform X2 [Haliotis rubra]|uniref:hemagglutinin/amebocyte aggregation factor-like isoform X2 n=1 Tax=Haliotis rubra TaxID=36100 RepID=UPI001EE58FA2|nr:hemagglutinin/amebocyte aggregation factor-like isoform X2 [Haliotis rubra]